MKEILALKSTIRFANRLKRLRERRRMSKTPISTREKRQSLSKAQRNLILKKTGDRCHICGGKIRKDENWHADHVFAHSHGGEHSIDNYLAAHSLCNQYRRNYDSEEFQWIMKLGVWLRTLIEKRDNQSMFLAEKFIKYERHRITRQNSSLVKSAVKSTMKK